MTTRESLPGYGGPPVFDAAFREDLRRLFVWRRDVRGFRRDPLPGGTLERLLAFASLSPSVGLSEPWRFVVVESKTARHGVRTCFAACNADALRRQSDERAGLYARLKLAGLDDAPCQFAVFTDHATAQGHGLGRATMPETADYSAVMAIHTIWLAARAEGLGLGWVSILDPGRMAEILDVPRRWTFIGYLCLGYPSGDYDTPELEREGWDARSPGTTRTLTR